MQTAGPNQHHLGPNGITKCSRTEQHGRAEADSRSPPFQCARMSGSGMSRSGACCSATGRAGHRDGRRADARRRRSHDGGKDGPRRGDEAEDVLLPQQNGQTVRKQMDARRTRGRRGQGRDGESADGQAEMDLQMPALLLPHGRR